jgi:acyl carrier protein
MKERIITMIKDACALAESNINEKTKLSEISLDSLSFIQLIVNLEDEFDIQFEDEELNIYDFKTVNDLVDIVEEKINEKK